MAYFSIAFLFEMPNAIAVLRLPFNKWRLLSLGFFVENRKRLVFLQPPQGAPGAESIVRKLHNAGLDTYLYLSVQEDEIICKIR